MKLLLNRANKRPQFHMNHRTPLQLGKILGK